MSNLGRACHLQKRLKREDKNLCLCPFIKTLAQTGGRYECLRRLNDYSVSKYIDSASELIRLIAAQRQGNEPSIYLCFELKLLNSHPINDVFHAVYVAYEFGDQVRFGPIPGFATNGYHTAIRPDRGVEETG